MQAAQSVRSRCHWLPGIVGGLGLALLASCSTTRVDTSAVPGPAVPSPAARGPAASAPASRPDEVFPDDGSGAPLVADPDADRGNPPFYDVFGERYFVMDSGYGYVEQGIASWYGEAFHGQPTSGGEPYDMYAMTAAHRTLPIPMWVEVTNLENGRRVVVEINDRGPFVDNRIIDLSFRAAEYLGMVEEGTALVEVRALGVPGIGPVAPAAPATADADGAGRGGGSSIIGEALPDSPESGPRVLPQIFVQVGAFSERENADALAERLRLNGFADSFVVTDSEGGGPLHRVRIGPLDDADHTDEINAGLRSIGIDASQLIFDN